MAFSISTAINLFLGKSQNHSSVLLELCQAWCCDQHPREPLPVPSCPMGKEPSNYYYNDDKDSDDDSNNYCNK